MGLFERFVAGVAAAIAAVGSPAGVTNPQSPPAIIGTGAPTAIPPLPRPRPDPALQVAAPPEERGPLLTFGRWLATIHANATMLIVLPEPGTIPRPAVPAIDAAVAANNAIITNFPETAGGNGMAAFGGVPVTFYAPPAAAQADVGAGAAIDLMLRGAFGVPEPIARLGPDTAPLPRANPTPAEERIVVAALPGNNPFMPGDYPPPRADDACVTRLAGLGVIATPLPPIDDAGACGIATPIDLAMVGRADLTLTPDATVDCAVAAPLTGWLENDVQDAAERFLGQAVTGIRVAASYACRGRNNDPTAQLSEHAFGRAIDISGFQLADGTWVTVTPYATGADAEPAEKFLAEIREAACGPFTTVLGPGVAYHDDHFHLDLADRSAYCR